MDTERISQAISILNSKQNYLKTNNFKALYENIREKDRRVVTSFLMNELKISNLLTKFDSIPSFFAAGTDDITGITIPENITSIGNGAFSNSGLRSVNIQAKLRGCGKEVFANNPNLTTVYFADGIKEIPERMFENDKSLQQVLLPRTVVNIGKGAFSGCDNVRIVTEKRGDPETALRFARSDAEFLRAHLTTQAAEQKKEGD